MAKLSDLVLLTSEITEISEATVREVSRRLREGRLIQTGKGGRYGGADMVPKDAASLLTALLVLRSRSQPITDIVPMTKFYLRLTSHAIRGNRVVWDRWDRRLALPQLQRLKSGHTFEEAFTALIISFSNGDFERQMVKWNGVRLEIEVGGWLPAVIRFHTGTYGLLSLGYIEHGHVQSLREDTPKNWSEILEAVPDFAFSLGATARLSEQTLKTIGILLRNLEPRHG
jgi:hypothetical protein